MWLINTTSLKLEHFLGPETAPNYAILSHTWGEQEVTFQCFQDLQTAKTKAGFAKIQKTCDLARNKDGLGYAWVDTCCIDKSSSAELSESINSMYNWYRRSKVCYVYLSDWYASSGQDWAALNDVSDGPNPLRWFTRGWTLQELIAPTNIDFYNESWLVVGSKSDPLIIAELARITGISPDVLKDGTEINLRRTCLGQRMSWVSRRETTRKEDIAYCLLGIFQVNMPLLYGEGSRAFLRLQEEIIKTSTDFSLFAWQAVIGDRRSFQGILSDHPRRFKTLGDCKPSLSLFCKREGEEAVMTNKGLRIHTSSLFTLSRHRIPVLSDAETFCLFLGCTTKGRTAYILIRSSSGSYVRVASHYNTDEFITVGQRMQPRTIHIMAHPPTVDNNTMHRTSAYRTGLLVSLQWMETNQTSLRLIDAWPRGLFDVSSDHEHTILLGTFTFFVGYVELAISDCFREVEFQNLIIVVHRLPGTETDTPPSIHLLRRDEASHLLSLRERIQDLEPTSAERALLAVFDPSLLPSRENGIETPTALFRDGIGHIPTSNGCKLLFATVELTYEPSAKFLTIELEERRFLNCYRCWLASQQSAETPVRAPPVS